MRAGEITAALVDFARALRRAGIDATPDRVHAMLAAVDTLQITDSSDVYWSGRLTLCAEPDDIPAYDAAFAAYFGSRTRAMPPGLPAPAVRRPTAMFADDTPANSQDGHDSHHPEHAVALLASDTDVLRQRDVAALSATERAEVRRLIQLLAPDPAPRPTRRLQPSVHGRVDPRRTVGLMLRRLGEPARPVRHDRRLKPRRLVLLVDVSGSMEPYADALLRFAHAAVRRRPASTEVFTIGTRLTRITRALRHRDPDAALGAAGQTIPDWHGGTRLAESIQSFLNRWGQRGTARGAIVVICSDGWERGDPDQLAGQLGRLSRLAYRLVWVNPHRGKPGYEPLAGGMAAALPYLDDFVAGHSLASLHNLVKVIAHA